MIPTARNIGLLQLSILSPCGKYLSSPKFAAFAAVAGYNTLAPVMTWVNKSLFFLIGESPMFIGFFQQLVVFSLCCTMWPHGGRARSHHTERRSTMRRSTSLKNLAGVEKCSDDELRASDTAHSHDGGGSFYSGDPTPTIQQEQRQPFSWFHLIFPLSIFSSSSSSSCAKSRKHHREAPTFCLADIESHLYFLPVSFAFVLQILFCNLCLRDVFVTTYQVARSTGVLFNAAMCKWKGRSSKWSEFCCFIISLGVAFGSTDSESLGMRGVLYGVAASFCGALFMMKCQECLEYIKQQQQPPELSSSQSSSSSCEVSPLPQAAARGAAAAGSRTSPRIIGVVIPTPRCHVTRSERNDAPLGFRFLQTKSEQQHHALSMFPSFYTLARSQSEPAALARTRSASGCRRRQHDDDGSSRSGSSADANLMLVAFTSMHSCIMFGFIAMVRGEMSSSCCYLWDLAARTPVGMQQYHDLIEGFAVWPKVLLLLLVSGAIATALPLCTATALHVLSPTSLSVMGHAKSAIQIAGGFIIFGERLNIPRSLGIALTMVGCIGYSATAR